MTHKLEIVTPIGVKILDPHQVSQPGSLATERGAPRVSGYESQRELITGTPQDWRKQKLQSWRSHTGSHAHQDAGCDLIKDCNRFTFQEYQLRDTNHYVYNR